MPQDSNIMLLVAGIFMFCIYWFVHGLIALWIYSDCRKKNSPFLGWVGSYLGLSLFDMLIWMTVLILPLFARNVRLEMAILISAVLALVAFSSLFTLLFYVISSREKGPVTQVVQKGLSRRGTALDQTIKINVAEVARDALLVNLNYPDEPDKLPLNVGKTTFGRSKFANNVGFTKDKFISKKHARIDKSGKDYLLSDLKSEHGTLLERDGQKIEVTEPTALQDKDIICLGPVVRLQFVRK